MIPRWEGACLVALLGGVAACGSDRPGSPDATESPATATTCADAERRLGRRVCVAQIPDSATWEGISFPAAAIDQARSTTYLVPARSGARLSPLFVDANAFDAPDQSLHYKFLTESFPEFSLLEYQEYVDLILPPSREWFAGSLTEYVAPSQDPVFGFAAWDEGVDLASTITCAQFQDLYDTVNGRVDVGQVAIVPATSFQREVLAGCGLPVHDPSTALAYEAYTTARGCGTLRRYTTTELAAAEQQAAFGWQDILVTDQAPLDIETIISGIVTGTRQGELSHLNVRSASRGTPNCYVRGGYELLAQWEGQLVALECAVGEATVVPITPEEAQTCWASLRPDPVPIVPADLTWTELVPLLDLPTDTADERRAGVGRFGSKGTNLATLYQRIDPALQLQGFLIPVHHYDAFVTTNSWVVDLGAGPETLSFRDTIDRLLTDDTFLTDGAVRRARLTALQLAMESAPCDPALIASIEHQILSVFGADDVMVRFRSSSNAEDALNFNGAGLYSSTSVCLADETDGDALGPSHCDPSKSGERDVCRGLRRVWASLWNMKAFEELDWYGIDHQQVAMGILVNTRTAGELANVVAFTGNPLLRGDRRYLVNAQLGELDVVSALPGVWPEKVLLTLDAGAVVEIERARGSTELPEGQWVLDDALLQSLGAALFQIATVYPVDSDLPPTARILLDTEWKLRSDGRLAIKQIRPFLE